MPKRLFLEFDKAGAEWVVVAYLTGDENMLRVVNEGLSPHVITGSLISGAPDWFVEKENKLIGHMNDAGEIEDLRKTLDHQIKPNWYLPRTMSIRQAGKKSNHALNYGLGARRFALEQEMEEREAKSLRLKYLHDAYPAIPKWWNSIEAELGDNRTLYNCFGRKRKFYKAWGIQLFEQGYAFKPQSTVVDLINRGMTSIYNSNAKVLSELDLLAQVHDSLLYQIEFDDFEDLAATCITVAYDHLSPELGYEDINGTFRKFHIGTDLKMGISWGEKAMHEVKLIENVKTLAERLEQTWGLIHGEGKTEA